MIKIDFGGIPATLENGVWVSPDDSFVTTLMELEIELDDTIYYPSRDKAIAELAIKRYGGKIISEDEMPFDNKTVY